MQNGHLCAGATSFLIILSNLKVSLQAFHFMHVNENNNLETFSKFRQFTNIQNKLFKFNTFPTHKQLLFNGKTQGVA